MKRLNILFISFFLLTVICFGANPAFAFEFNFYYEQIEEVYDPASTAPNGATIGETVGGWFTGEKVEIRQSNYVPPAGSANEGHDPIAYKVKTKKVSNLNQLYKAMGVTQQDYDNGSLTNGQKALIDTFKEAQSKAIQDRTEHANQKKCDVYLYDSSDFDTDPNVSTYVKDALKKDFWPCASGNKDWIRMSSRFFCSDANTDHAVSTFVHEYSHTLDVSTFQESNPYGLDGTHYYNEITTKSAAFKEAWAEYNEMIEFDSTRDNYLSYSKETSTLKVESKTERGNYTTIKASDCTADQLLSNEMFMNRMLYELHELLGKDSNGKDIVSNAFYETNSSNNNMSNLIQQLIQDNPDYAIDIIRIVDEVTLKKMSDDELLSFVGKSEAFREYRETRNNTDDSDKPKDDGSKGKVDEGSARRRPPTEDKENNTPKIATGSLKLPVLRKLSNDDKKDNKGKGVVIEVESDDPFGE